MIIKVQEIVCIYIWKFLGYCIEGWCICIMVILFGEVVEQLELVYEMVQKGMNCVWINCVYDGLEVWKKMIVNVCMAFCVFGVYCQVVMDFVGFKICIGEL